MTCGGLRSQGLFPPMHWSLMILPPNLSPPEHDAPVSVLRPTALWPDTQGPPHRPSLMTRECQSPKPWIGCYEAECHKIETCFPMELKVTPKSPTL